MGLHVVIGKGNLGLDIKAALELAGHDVRLLSSSGGFSWPQSKTELLALQPEGVWVAAGFGSVEQCKANFQGALNTHVILPVELAMCLPASCKLALFSTDYVADESEPSAPAKHTPRPKSLYACSKLWMEQAIYMMGRPNTTIFRVGSLFGHHFPDRGFPGKLTHRNPTPCDVSLPQNWAVPTPTWWVANTIVDCMDRAFGDKGPLTHHIAPAGGCTLLQWATKILGSEYVYKSRGFDDTRPAFSKLGCSLIPAPQWEELWTLHLQQAQNAAGQRSFGP